MSDKLKIRIVEKMDNIHLRPGEIVVETDHLMSQIKKPFTKVRSDKPGASGYEDSFHWIGLAQI